VADPAHDITLAFDTSGPACCAAILSGDRVLAERVEDMARGQAERLVPLLDELLSAAGCALQDVSRIGVGTGPGNFTGIRISVAAARGLALSLGCPAIGVSTLDALAHGLPRPCLTVVLARRGAGEAVEHVMLFVSRAGERGYVQITHVAPTNPAEAMPAPSDPVPETADGSLGFEAALRDAGHVVLRGLDFDSGEAVLGPGPHPDLAALAAFLEKTSEARIALVGHTDNVGALDANIALSQARAEAVRARLVADHGIAGARIEARGVGYLAPVAPNDTPQGREANRRVEVVLLQ